MNYLPKAQARLLYRISQEREEEMIEVRRQMELEHIRAGAGGIVMNSTGQPLHQQNNSQSPLEAIANLKQLLESELITLEEFQNKKDEILRRI